MGSPGAQFTKPRDEWSVQAQPTGNAHCVSVYTGKASFFPPTCSSSLCLTVVVPGEADPQVVMPGAVEVSDELHLGSAVHRR